MPTCYERQFVDFSSALLTLIEDPSADLTNSCTVIVRNITGKYVCDALVIANIQSCQHFGHCYPKTKMLGLTRYAWDIVLTNFDEQPPQRFKLSTATTVDADAHAAVADGP